MREIQLSDGVGEEAGLVLNAREQRVKTIPTAMGGRDFQGIAGDGRPAMGGWPEPHDLRREPHGLRVAIARLVIQCHSNAHRVSCPWIWVRAVRDVAIALALARRRLAARQKMVRALLLR